MNTLPRTVTNPDIGDKVTFLKTAAETNGEYALVEVELAPGGGNGLHYHVTFIEVFDVIQGVLGIQYGKEIMSLKAGESATVPLNVVHRFFNPSPDKTVKFRTTIKPARHFEEMIRIAYGLANDGRTNKKGMPKSIWDLSILFEKGESYLPTLPLRIQKGLFGLLAYIARLKGRDKALLKYYSV